MISPQDIIISKFRFTYSKSNEKVKLLDELNNIKSDKYKSIIKECRIALHNNDKEGYSNLKSQLPCVTFGATFQGTHGIKNLLFYNHLLILDIDKITNEKLIYLCEVLKNDEFIFSFWISPSGLGIKGLIRISNDIQQYKDVFNYFKKYFKDKYDTELDASGSNINRPCYASHDNNLYLNLNSKVFTLEGALIDKNVIRKTKANNISGRKSRDNKHLGLSFGLNNPTNRIIMQKIISYLKKNKKSITTTHDQWYKCAFAISKTFSYDVGRKYYKELCMLDADKYDEEGSEDKLIYCYETKNRESGITFATIIYYAEQVGFINYRKTNTKVA